MKKECKNCKKTFVPERANQIYCSNSCKQKAFKERKIKNQNNSEEIIKMVFSISDFEYCQDLVCGRIYNDNDFDLDPIMYFYLIQTYKEADIKKKGDYILSMCHHGRSNFARFRKMNEFIEFEKKYLNGSFDIV
ncbi:hypothetical protein EGI26_11065 [Lacihabitans sp. CCS-44]|uniref:hypothetical protein n=1 Tax=Lacihabitans sp. CCS-44 TaxID=2487331 RepID=UPI0020CE433A|nr:hypothetical protein [Lacihabitans sp. CCS-44]MCP9755695.1 hypothetical protein [Lacihabitans sp. CCS-44]